MKQQLHQKSSIRSSFGQQKYSNQHHHRCFEDDYQKLSDIGQGSYGDVFTAQQKNGEIRAIKRILLNPLSQDYQQVQKLKMFKNDHIIQYYGYIVQNQFLYIIMKYCKGNLRDLIKNNKITTPQQVINLIMQITSAMLCLEEKKVMHLDLKPENILYEDQGYFKICDFGCSRLYQNASKVSHMNLTPKKAQKSHLPVHFNQSDQFIFGTPQYIAPQVQLNVNQIPKSSCDVWSMGIILYQLIYHKHPFKLNTYGKVQTQDFKAFKQNKLYIDFPQTQLNYPINLIKQMLKSNQFKRITWNKIRLYLIQHYGKQQAQFINIQRAANNQINISIIFISVAYTIESYVKKQQDQFMKDNLEELIAIKILLVKLAHGLLIKFYRLFDYKIKNKLNATTRISLQFMFESTKQQYRKLNTQQNLYDNQKIRKLQYDLYVKLDNLNNKITNQDKSRQEMIDKISCFVEQAIKLKSYFCEGHRLKNTYQAYSIQDQA